MADENVDPAELEPRDPTVADLRELCRELNRRGARYIVIVGFAVRAAGYLRHTMDIDLLVDTSGDNEQRVLEAVATLPDGAARQVTPGEIEKWGVVRIGDEVVVDLMKSACALDYTAAKSMIQTRRVDDVEIPFASPDLLWLTKEPTHRPKDAGDLFFLRELFQTEGRQPPTR